VSDDELVRIADVLTESLPAAVAAIEASPRAG
jgi:hypothetical protein